MELLIVGLGSMGKRRARLLRGLVPEVEIAGVDSAPGRREEARALGITAYESLAVALAAGGFDGALVCTAPLSHAAIIGQLLDAKLPVFTELNLVDDGYDENIRKAKEKGVPLFLSSTMLYRGETQYIKRRVQEFGRPVNYIYHIGQYLPDWHPWENYKNFFVGDARTGGVREIFGIDLPWLLDTFGPVTGFTAMKDKISNLEIAYPDSVFVTLRHENGVKGMLAVDVVSPKAVRNFECFGEGLHLFWEGNPKALYRYELECALPLVTERVEARLGVHADRWQVRHMTSRWGSCTPESRSIRISSLNSSRGKQLPKIPTVRSSRGRGLRAA